jgi:hypothetical protein
MLGTSASKTRQDMCRDVIPSHLCESTDWATHGFVRDLDKSIGELVSRLCRQSFRSCVTCRWVGVGQGAGVKL